MNKIISKNSQYFVFILISISFSYAWPQQQISTSGKAASNLASAEDTQQDSQTQSLESQTANSTTDSDLSAKPGVVEASAVSSQDISQLLLAWPSLMKEGKYADAIAIFESILQKAEGSKVLNESQKAAIYFNLAYANYQMARTAKALAYWRQTQNIAPNFPGLSEAFVFAEKAGHLPLQEGAKYSFYKLMNSLSSFQIYVLSLLVISLSLYLWMTWWKQKTDSEQQDFGQAPRIRSFHILFSLLSCILLFMSLAKLYFSHQRLATIVSKEGNLYLWPEPNSETAFKMEAGMEVFLLKENKGWFLVENHLGKQAWIPISDIYITDGNNE